jgi:hypothetical protein
MVSVRERLDSPAIRGAIAPVSLVLIGLGVIVLVSSIFAGSGSAPPPANPGAAAQADLRTGIAAAQTFFNQQHPHTYEGFTTATAAKIDAGITWNKGPGPTAGEVTIKSAGKAGVLLLSQSGSSATIYCIAATPVGQTMGAKLAVKPSDCTGGW